MSDTDADDDDDGAYYVVPEEAIQYLPREWQEAIYARAEDGRTVLEAADTELQQLSRLSLSFSHVTVLQHIRDNLAVYRFKADMAALLELAMLTTAFVATYVRLHTGGSGSGFARDALPEALRSAPDEIIDIRNTRYDSVATHDSVGPFAKIVKRKNTR